MIEITSTKKLVYGAPLACGLCLLRQLEIGLQNKDIPNKEADTGRLKTYFSQKQPPWEFLDLSFN